MKNIVFQSLNAWIFSNAKDKILVKTHTLNQKFFFDKDTVIVDDKLMPIFVCVLFFLYHDHYNQLCVKLQGYRIER